MLNKIILIFIILSTPLAFAQRLEKALQAYQNGDFKTSTQLYLSELESGNQNSSLYFNIGNSFYKQGHLGEAIAAYIRAHELAPRNPDIKTNLQFAEAKVMDQVSPRKSTEIKNFLLLKSIFSTKELVYFGVITSILFSFFSLLGIYLGVRERYTVMKSTLAIFACIPLLIGSYRFLKPQYWGAISSPVVDVYAGPSDKNSVVVFMLHEGTPVRKLEEQGDWLQVALPDQKVGWIRQKNASFF